MRKDKGNLKLEQRTLGFGNKLGIAFIAFLLIAAGLSGVNATIRLEDPSGATSGYWGDGTTIRNSNGKSWTATETNLQSAIYDLNGTGGTVWIPSSNISVSSYIFLANNTEIVGTGNTTLYLADGTDESIMRTVFDNTGYGLHDITIRGIIFNGNKVGQTAKCGAISTAGNSKRINIFDCIIKNTWEDGIKVELYSEDILISNCFFNDIGSTTSLGNPAGIVIQGDNVTVENCKFNNCFSNGIGVEGGAGNPASRVVIDGNIITGGRAGNGIWLEGSGLSENCIVSNNLIYNLDDSIAYTGNYTGITIGAKNITVMGNIIINLSLGGPISDGIQFTAGASNCIVSGNYVEDVGRYGILLASVENNIVNLNIIKNTGDNGIHVYNSGNITISDNEIVDAGENGTYMIGGSGNNILNSNRIINPVYDGIHDNTGSSYASNNYIEAAGNKGIFRCLETIGNTVVDATTVGINHKKEYSLCTGNRVFNSGSYGIWMQSGDNSSCTGNIVETTHTTAIIINGVSSSVISNNIATSTNGAGVGIAIDGTSDYNVVIGNNCRWSNTNITDGGTGNLVKYNL